MANLPGGASWKLVRLILSLAVVLFGVGEATNISPAKTGHRRRRRHWKASKEGTILAIRLRGGSGATTITQQQQEAHGPLIQGAYDWCVNLGAPSALVAGAVVATDYENMEIWN